MLLVPMIAEKLSGVPAEAADVTGRVTHETTPALVSNVRAPNSALSNWLKPVDTRPPAKVEVAAVEVAWKYSPTAGPTTESVAYGEVVPIPTFPALVMTNLSVVPSAVELAIANRPFEISYPIVHCPAEAPENESAAFVVL